MKSARLVILAVAAMAAAGAGIIAMNMTAAPPDVVETVAPVPQIQLQDVLVATENLGVGAEVRDQLRWQPWPAEAISDGYITRDAEPQAIGDLKGSTVRLQLMAGEPIRKAKLIGPGQSFMSSMLPPGMRAVATQISADTSAGGFILPNDFVDVIMTRRRQETGNSGPAFLTETILQNIRVLAIDQAIQEDEKGNKVIVGQTATLELTPQQAEIIIVAQQMADRLSLALRSTHDAQEPAGEEADYLVSAPGRRGTVKLIKSGTVTEVGAR
ncbi:Flp pilus assembly protein CpaB [Phyllobacterium salinisoli]|uniref:Flp pilus assembly protein CpaB n=1 Tax=Phyllobacterium salinisoli TaxID=1899321 RepID=A0A368K738_9HYPH|nr:Flp pilus assembly protein CpaB [Phyllobacterium salinisoli]RCS25024.1 Flp pilus assembly protein CpaB [Phyllobacterium salinisoli]